MRDPGHIVTAAELEHMTPQQRADVVEASIVRADEDPLPERLRAEINETAVRLGEQRRARA